MVSRYLYPLGNNLLVGVVDNKDSMVLVLLYLLVLYRLFYLDSIPLYYILFYLHLLCTDANATESSIYRYY